MDNHAQAAKRAAELAFGTGAICYPESGDRRAFAKYIQHVSDVAKRVRTRGLPIDYVALDGLILPDEPDPLVEVLKEAGFGTSNDNGRIDRLRAALKARGLQITEVPK